MEKKIITFLGNCVAERLIFMLRDYPKIFDFYALERHPIMPLIKKKDLKKVAYLLTKCDIIFIQPLFNYGVCNTDQVRGRLVANQRLFTISSPNFSAYFPDACVFNHPGNLNSVKLLDWDSRIIFSCFVKGVPIFDVEKIYTSHWLFQKENTIKQIDASVEDYLLREKGVDLSTDKFFIKNFAKTKLLHSPRHPVLSFLWVMYSMILDVLGLKKIEITPNFHIFDFGYDQWPIITRHHNFFSFPEQAYFVMKGKTASIEDMAMAYYVFYSKNPHVVEANLHHIIDL